MLISAVVAAGLTALGFLVATKSRDAKTPSSSTLPPSSSVAATITSLIDPQVLPLDADPALLNLLCAPGVTAAEMSAYLKTLDEWATAIGDSTRRNHHRYLENPKEFASEAEWKLAMMCTVIGQDFKVRYDPALSTATQLNSSNQQFFAKSAPVFISGCLGPERTGTCASLPVLYVALGRRLGYPMQLVTAKNHLFARWDDSQGTRVNLEAANAGGFTTHPDAHYRTWPFPISPEEEKAGGYLLNLDATRMLAIFLCTRAICLEAAQQPAEAARAAAAAYRIAPALAGTGECLWNTLARRPDASTAEILHRQEANRMRQRGSITGSGLPPEPVPGVPYSSLPGNPANPGIPNLGVSGIPRQPGHPYQSR